MVPSWQPHHHHLHHHPPLLTKRRKKMRPITNHSRTTMTANQIFKYHQWSMGLALSVVVASSHIATIHIGIYREIINKWSSGTIIVFQTILTSHHWYPWYGPRCDQLYCQIMFHQKSQWQHFEFKKKRCCLFGWHDGFELLEEIVD